MNFYDKIDILPLRNWSKLNEGIAAGNPDWSLLSKDASIDDESKKKAEKLHSKLISQLKKVNIGLSLAWSRFNLANHLIIADTFLNEYNESEGIKQVKIKYDNAERLLVEYLTELDANFEKFRIPLYSFKENYSQLWKDVFDAEVPEWLHELKGLQFHYILQYINKLDADDLLEKQEILKSKSFFNVFFEKSHIEIDSMKPVNDAMIKDFANDRMTWIKGRANIFRIDNINAVSKSESNYVRDVLMLNQITGQNHDPKTISVAEFQELLEIAQQKIENAKKK